MATRVTTKDILAAVKDVISSVEENSPNGDIKVLGTKVDTLCKAQANHRESTKKRFDEIDTALLKLTKRLYNPDDGVVVTVKENTRIVRETRTAVNQYASEFKRIDGDVQSIQVWKKNINKTLWITLPILVSGVAYAVKVMLGG